MKEIMENEILDVSSIEVLEENAAETQKYLTMYIDDFCCEVEKIACAKEESNNALAFLEKLKLVYIDTKEMWNDEIDMYDKDILSALLQEEITTSGYLDIILERIKNINSPEGDKNFESLLNMSDDMMITYLLSRGVEYLDNNLDKATCATANLAIKKLIKNLGKDNIAVLAGKISVFDGIMTYIINKDSDKGDYTLLDIQRNLLNSSKNTILMLSWGKISELCAATSAEIFGTGSAIAGPVAGIGTAAIGLLVSKALDSVISLCTGDYVIKNIEIDIDGETKKIPVYGNGNGKNGTYDVLIENFENEFCNTRINYCGEEISYDEYHKKLYGDYDYCDQTMSYVDYKEMLYSDFRNTCNNSNKKNVPLSEEEIEYVTALMEKIKNCENFEEIEDYIFYESPLHGLALAELFDGTEFDLQEYFNYTHYGHIW